MDFGFKTKSVLSSHITGHTVPILENFTWDFSTKQNYWARQLIELGKSIILVKCNAFLGGWEGSQQGTSRLTWNFFASQVLGLKKACITSGLLKPGKHVTFNILSFSDMRS